MWAIVTLAGCTDVLRSPTGTETLRGGLWFDEVLDDTSGQTHASLLLLANSPLPCNPEAVADDPDTTDDEAASAQVYWQGQIASALTREHAFVVAIELLSHSTVWTGTYDVDNTTVYNAVASLNASSNPAWAFWFQIQEATLDDNDGFFYTYIPTLVAYDNAVPAPGTVNVEEDGDRLDGDFLFSADHVSGTFGVERCDNQSLYNQLWQYLLNISTITAG